MNLNDFRPFWRMKQFKTIKLIQFHKNPYISVPSSTLVKSEY